MRKFINNLLKPSTAIVLMYHKIGSPKTDPWLLAVSEENFDQQMAWLSNNLRVVALGQLIGELKAGKIIQNSVAVTFDDGYEDNYILAKPILEKYGIPATFFITDRNLEDGKSFWWDDLEEIALHSGQLPASIHANGSEIDLGDEMTIAANHWDGNARFYAMEPINKRSELYYMLWQEFGPLKWREQDIRLAEVKAWANRNSYDVDKCMSKEQLKDLSSNELFTIGAHTHSHPALEAHSIETQFFEIKQNLDYLYKLTGSIPEFIAYPSGSYNENTLEVVDRLGLEAGLTTVPVPISKKTKPFEMGRFQVMDWGREDFSYKCTQWLGQ
ncbi:polysaccharide deacetylase family protein [Litoribacter alkaliphilus]|uniref:Polysaccharide deacetylase family protein n=1 Tax=Litoribacter ruber TaxID=702568 RepID=A0AAP2CIM7_9BACT|nr:polysaccharide deacetylase family protein [Litoribacter alkaliphilus]MBS9523961.1 polysaccharide deacetylase family protein [Litoribacter alkaliphilus]